MKTLVSLCLLFALAFTMKPTIPSTGSYYAIDAQNNLYPISKAQTVNLFQSNSKYVASAAFIDDRNNSGWTFYQVNTSSEFSDNQQAYSAGYLEGILGWAQIYQNFMDQDVNGQELASDMIDFVNAQNEWIATQVKQNPSDNYWQLVSTVLSQYNGIYDGYHQAVSLYGSPSQVFTYQNFYWVSYGSDLADVISKYNGTIGLDESQHCSFLLKLTDDDLFVSHDTWAPFTQMLKVFKTLNYSYSNPAVQNQVLQFSSTPGCMPSIDDFYMMDNNRFVSETTIVNWFNPNFWDYLHSDTVPYWIRIHVANLAWDNQQTWMNYFFKFRSGTYNNQWMVIDFNQYYANKDNLAQAENIVWVIEEFYAMTSAQDVTQTYLIPQGFFASYNVPFNPLLQAYSQGPAPFTYTTAPRYFLFNKYAPGIQDIDDFKYVMRLNNYSDYHNYSEAIASRFDLLSDSEASPFGAIDSKVTAASLIPNLQAWLILGPTSQDVPAFSWNDWPTYSSWTLGMPQTYTFDWYFYDLSEISEDEQEQFVN